jgi:hypothetical protein
VYERKENANVPPTKEEEIVVVGCAVPAGVRHDYEITRWREKRQRRPSVVSTFGNWSEAQTLPSRVWPDGILLFGSSLDYWDKDDFIHSPFLPAEGEELSL